MVLRLGLGTRVRGYKYWVQEMGQGLRPGPQVFVFTSLTRFSSLSNFAISTAGPFCTSCPFFSWSGGSTSWGGMVRGGPRFSGSHLWLLCPACPSFVPPLFYPVRYWIPASPHSHRVLPQLRLGDMGSAGALKNLGVALNLRSTKGLDAGRRFPPTDPPRN